MDDIGPAGMSFPQKVHTAEEEFVIELDDSHMTHDGYGFDERARCKRRKRCGQCGPCQIKINCMKCHFCIRKDVLKQACIYRKCVYLRSKSKPYHRLYQRPHGHLSPSREASPGIRSPDAAVHTGMSFDMSGIHMSEPRPDDPFFPQQLPQHSPHVGSPCGNGYLPPNTAGITNTNMQMSVSPQVSNHATSPPIQKNLHPTSPLESQPLNSPPSIPSPISSCSNCIPHLPSVPCMTSNSFATMAQMSTIANMAGIGDRSVNEFLHSDQFVLPPHHPHYPAVHQHLTQRDHSLFGDHARIPHMNFNPGPNDSCMYHPGLPYAMQGHFRPSGPSFLSGASDVNPFRTNFFNSFPPGYSYPADRYREGFGPLSFPRLGMAATPSFPQYPGQAAGYGIGSSFPQQYYNSQHGCPKNCSHPPVSPSADDVKVLQAGYKQENISPVPESSPDEYLSSKSVQDQDEMNAWSELTVSERRYLQKCQQHNKAKQKHRSWSRSGRPASQFIHPEESQHIQPEFPYFPTPLNHLRVFSDFFHNRSIERSNSISSQSSKSSCEPWRTANWFSPRQEDVCSRASTSTVCSDFERVVISIDDQPVNVFIRFCGCNSIEIKLDDRSMCSNDSMPRRLPASTLAMRDFLSPLRNNCFQPIDIFQIPESRSLFSPWHNDLDSESDLKLRLAVVNSNEKLPNGNENGTSCGTDRLCQLKEKPSEIFSNERSNVLHVAKKFQFKSSVCLKQDLGNDGVMQIEIPGDSITIENTVLSEELEKQCSNLMELKEFLSGKTNVELTIAGSSSLCSQLHNYSSPGNE